MTWSNGRSALLGALMLAIGVVVMLVDSIHAGVWVMLGGVDVALYIELVIVIVRRSRPHPGSVSLHYVSLLSAIFVANVVTLGLIAGGVHTMEVTAAVIATAILLVEFLRSMFVWR